MKVLNLYAGIGGNRKLWTNCEVTAVELNPQIAEVYKSFFPMDNVIAGDAHEYLLKHFSEYDFIWASPPCPTHSRLRTMNEVIVYPDMSLYQEILLLKHWFKGKWIVENVIPYYEPLIQPSIIIHRHFVWANFTIRNNEYKKLKTCKIKEERNFLQEEYGFNVDNFEGIDKRKTLRNCVVPELGLWIYEQAQGILREENTDQLTLFKSAV